MINVLNRISSTFKGGKDICSIYFTAGYPKLNDTVSIIQELEKNGVNLIEIGLPFSDPLADGPTIQNSSAHALSNGMTTNILFEQLKDIRSVVDIPLVIMGYINPILQFGIKDFCKRCNEIGIDGLIVPDLPIDIYLEYYKILFKENNLNNIFLITPETSEERIRFIDSQSDHGFIYMVSSSSTTGDTNNQFNKEQMAYFQKIQSMKLSSPCLIGFGINNHITYSQACEHSHGTIIGSAFIKHLHKEGIKNIDEFINQIRK